jgi:uncharacterized protein
MRPTTTTGITPEEFGGIFCTACARYVDSERVFILVCKKVSLDAAYYIELSKVWRIVFIVYLAYINIYIFIQPNMRMVGFSMMVVVVALTAVTIVVAGTPTTTSSAIGLAAGPAFHCPQQQLLLRRRRRWQQVAGGNVRPVAVRAPPFFNFVTHSQQQQLHPPALLSRRMAALSNTGSAKQYNTTSCSVEHDDKNPDNTTDDTTFVADTVGIISSTLRNLRRTWRGLEEEEDAVPLKMPPPACCAETVVRTYPTTSAASFNPVPWLRHCHVQTISGFLLRESRWGAVVVTDAEEDNENARNGNDALIPSVLLSAADTFSRLVSLLPHGRNNHREERSPPRPPNHPLRSSSGGSTTEGDTKKPTFWDHRERIDTPDGDFFHADTKYATAPGANCDAGGTSSAARDSHGGAPTVILLHGLGSSSGSPTVHDMARAYTDRGMDVVCLNFRGCSGVPNDTLGAYHLGFTDDVKLYLTLLRTRRRQTTAAASAAPVYLSGFSLGANVVLKCLGELGESAAQEFDVAGAAVLCAPFDQTKNARCLVDDPFNRLVYTANILKNLKEQTRTQLKHLYNNDPDATDRFDYRACMAAKTIMEYENASIAPIYGFDDCWDYYRKTSCIHYMDRIRVPTMVLNAEDDPFFDPSVWPVQLSTERGGPAPLKMVRTRYGGHVGYWFHQQAHPSKVDDDVDSSSSSSLPLQQQPPVASWPATEMGRFLAHVQSFYD